MTVGTEGWSHFRDTVALVPPLRVRWPAPCQARPAPLPAARLFKLQGLRFRRKEVLWALTMILQPWACAAARISMTGAQPGQSDRSVTVGGETVSGSFFPTRSWYQNHSWHCDIKGPDLLKSQTPAARRKLSFWSGSLPRGPGGRGGRVTPAVEAEAAERGTVRGAHCPPRRRCTRPAPAPRPGPRAHTAVQAAAPLRTTFKSHRFGGVPRPPSRVLAASVLTSEQWSTCRSPTHCSAPGRRPPCRDAAGSRPRRG